MCANRGTPTWLWSFWFSFKCHPQRALLKTHTHTCTHITCRPCELLLKLPVSSFWVQFQPTKFQARKPHFPMHPLGHVTWHASPSFGFFAVASKGPRSSTLNSVASLVTKEKNGEKTKKHKHQGTRSFSHSMRLTWRTK